MEFHIFTSILTIIIYIILKYNNYNNVWYAIFIPILLYSYKFFFINASIINTTSDTLSSTLMLEPYPTSSN